MLTDLDASVRFVHVVDDLRSRNDQRNVLWDKVEHSMMDRIVRHPDRPVLRHAEVTTQNRVIDVLQLMGIVNRFQIERRITKPRNHRAANFAPGPRLQCAQMSISFGDSFHMHRLTANELQDF